MTGETVGLILYLILMLVLTIAVLAILTWAFVQVWRSMRQRNELTIGRHFDNQFEERS